MKTEQNRQLGSVHMTS